MGESIAEGTVSRWLKKVGDTVKRDEPIFEISTDKVDAEIPSPSAGVLAEIIVGEGKTVAVDTVVARLETEAGAFVPAAPAAASSPAPPSVPAPMPVPAAPLAAPLVSPHAPSPAAATNALTAPGVSSAGGNGGSLADRLRTKSSPLVRRIAAEHGVEIAGMSGSGVQGRVTKRDILAFIESGAAAAPTAGHAAAIAVPASDAHVPAATPWPGDVVEPMTKLRKLTFDHMAVAKRVAAHVTTVWEIDLTRVARVRAKMR
jgi:2-oxoglutarate dehydrogenase E2 component (dihydrolipoamide succinyltransferase)